MRCVASLSHFQNFLRRSQIKTGGLDDDTCDSVGVYTECLSKVGAELKRMLRTNVGGGTSVLEVAIALGTNVSRDTDGRTTVSDTRAESADVASLVAAGETEVVVLSVHSNVLIVALRELLDSSLNVLHSSGLTHQLGAVVRVASSTVPVTLEGFRVERDLDAPLLGDTNKQVASHPEVVTHGDTLTGANLELPLRRHDFRIDAGNVDTGVQTSAVVSLN